MLDDYIILQGPHVLLSQNYLIHCQATGMLLLMVLYAPYGIKRHDPLQSLVMAQVLSLYKLF